MKRSLALVLSVVLVFVVLSAASMALGALGSRHAESAPAVPTHRSGCHRAHTCPSDHATYRWRGWLCVKPTSPKRNSSFRKRIRYAGLTYYCKR